jgi:DNA primase
MSFDSTVLEILTKEKITYRDKGADFLVKCLSPEHEDDAPSMFVHKETGKFNCFSCGYRGNIFRLFGVFVSPVKDLAYKVSQEIMILQSQSRGLEVPLSSSPFVQDYRGISANTFKEHNAFVSSTEEYAGRLMFPITDNTGKIVLFNGRNIHTKTPPKYKYFPSGVQLPVYPTHTGSSYLVLVEGLFDYLNLYDKGMDNVSTIFGTNALTSNVIEEKLMHQVLSGVSVIILLFDADKAGRDAAAKVAEAIESKLHIRAINACHLLLDNTDPGGLTSVEVSALNRKIKKLIDRQGSFDV